MLDEGAKMYTDSTQKPIYDGEPYTSPNGTQYPSNFPKDEILCLAKVTESDRPTDASLVVTGFTIENNAQVWQTRIKTTEELNADALAKQARIDDLKAQLAALGA